MSVSETFMPAGTMERTSGGAAFHYPTWDDWLAIAPPHRDQGVVTEEVTLRFMANGVDWDAHGTLHRPAGAPLSEHGFVLLHGGAGSEAELCETPDGRPGLARVLASQGFPALAVSFVGHYPAGGVWTTSPAERMPVYLLDRELPRDEILHRNMLCTFDVHVTGAALLADHCFSDMPLIAFGHSTGGPMALALHKKLKKNKIVGLVGWGSGEPNGWSREWARWFSPAPEASFPIDSIARRSVESFRKAGYEDERSLCPWGGAAEYTAWADRRKSQFKTSLCDNQHQAIVEALPEYARRTGLPVEAYTGHLRDPDPDWLARTGVYLMLGEKDSRLWSAGRTAQTNRQIFASEKFATRALRSLTTVVPRYGHFGFAGLYNEKIAYLWLKALLGGFFRP
ncbi:MAG TPA: hypothetical protein VGO34_06805 [Alphaproteobacteria bacterium]